MTLTIKVPGRWHTVGPYYKNPLEKMKLIDYTVACKSLQNFEYEVNDRKLKLSEPAETYMATFLKLLLLNPFSVGFSHLEPMCSSAGSGRPHFLYEYGAV